MNLEFILTRFSHNADTIASLVQDISLEQARWRPQPEDWSILETINHLYDEEREDFRTRFDFLLHNPEADPPPIDPEGWVTARAYNERDLAASLHNFLQERQKSLDWLRGLPEPNWQSNSKGPWGVIHAGDMLAAWLAHDYLHIRQLNELHYAYWAQTAVPYAVRYAGEW